MHRRYQLLARLEERPLSENFTAQDVADPARKYLVKLFLQRFSTPEFASALWRESGDKARAIGCPHLMPYEEVGFVAGRLAAIRTLIDGYALDDGAFDASSKLVEGTAQPSGESARGVRTSLTPQRRWSRTPLGTPERPDRSNASRDGVSQHGTDASLRDRSWLSGSF